MPENGMPMRKRNDTARQTRAGPSQRRARPGVGAANSDCQEIDVGPLAGYLGYALRRAQLTAYADFIATLGEVAISPGEFGVLTIISQNPGLRPADVCTALGILKPNFVAVLASLERRDLVERRDAQNDRRAFALHLTASGTEILQRACTLQAEHEARLVKKLGARGRAQLLHLLNKLADSF
jgi:DNA-binding MarR family transcriptional regulator